MKKRISKNYLIVIAILAMTSSVFSLFLFLGKFDITGASSTGIGYTNVTVLETTDITVVRGLINFTATSPGVSKDSTQSSHLYQCDTDLKCGINITNDGSIAINISIENTEALFDSGTIDNSKHYLYNITLGDNSTDYTSVDCSTGGSQGLQLTGSWRAMPDELASEIAICCLNQTDSHDSVQVDINITVPDDEPAGVKSGTITFTASAWK